MRDWLGVTNVFWLGRGIAGDDTHGHVDDICRFVNPRTLVLIGETRRRDRNYRPLAENWERVRDLRLEDGSKPEVVALPMPAPLYHDGQRLPASYANFYIGNAAVLVPTFNDPNDRVALGILGGAVRGSPRGGHPRRRSRAGLRHAPLPDAAAAIVVTARGLLLAMVAALAIAPRPAPAQQPQNPSPMVEHTRAHPRLAEARPPGRREALDLGALFLPERRVPASRQGSVVPLLVVFHAGSWLPEVAGHQTSMAVIGVQITAGSAGYAGAVADPRRFPSLIEEAERKAGVRLRPITLVGWSAGCGALRELLRQPEAVSRVARVIAIDGIHTDYVDGKPGPLSRASRRRSSSRGSRSPARPSPGASGSSSCTPRSSRGPSPARRRPPTG